MILCRWREGGEGGNTITPTLKLLYFRAEAITRKRRVGPTRRKQWQSVRLVPLGVPHSNQCRKGNYSRKRGVQFKRQKVCGRGQVPGLADTKSGREGEGGVVTSIQTDGRPDESIRGALESCPPMSTHTAIPARTLEGIREHLM